MNRTYLKFASRSFAKNKFYALFNIFGLTIGFTGAFLISLYLTHELSYDKSFHRADDIYRLGIEYNFSGKIDQFCNVPRPVGPKFKEEFPEVETYTRLAGVNGLYTHKALLQRGENKIKSNKIFYADSTYFKVFQHRFIKGNPHTALIKPQSMVINETLAKALFGSEDAMGQTIRLDDGSRVQVTGLIADFEGNTHMPFDALISWSTIHSDADNAQWLGRHVYTYVLLQEQASHNTLIDKYDAFYAKYMAETFKQYDATNKLIIQPLPDIHLQSNLTWEAFPNGNVVNIYIFSAIAIILIVLSAINYINLETSRLVSRTREIGIKKVLGANKGVLVLQGLVESTITAMIAVLLSALLAWVLLPWFNGLAGISIVLNYLKDPWLLGLLLVSGIGLGLLTGVLPSVYLSRFHAVDSLSNKSSGQVKMPKLRSALVLLQLIASITLIIGALAVDRQVVYMKNIDPGFEKENTLVINLKDTVVSNHLSSVKAAFEALPEVLGVAAAVDTPGDELNQTVANVTKKNGERGPVGTQFMQVGFGYMEFMGMQLVEGRYFDKSFGSDVASSIIVNETAAQKFGWEGNYIGQTVDFGPNQDGTTDYYTVIGVMKDFHASSLHHEIQPILIFAADPMPVEGKLFLKLRGTNLSETLTQVEQTWSRFDQKNPAEYVFVDDNLASKYVVEEKIFSLLGYFAYLAIAISALGLFGLVSYTSNLRRKEVSIRKVLGSSVSGVFVLLSRDFMILLIVANVISWPLSYLGIQSWLDNFAYRTNLGLWIFAYAALISVMVTGVTIAFHILKTARANPVQYLRNE